MLKNRRPLKKFLPLLFKRENRNLASLNLIFCSDEYLLGINEQYLQHDDFTDIITFDLSDDPAEIRGEIYISLDRIRENAITFNCLPAEELHRVVFHGALHLCGYKDKTRDQKKKSDLRKTNTFSCMNAMFHVKHVPRETSAPLT